MVSKLFHNAYKIGKYLKRFPSNLWGEGGNHSFSDNMESIWTLWKVYLVFQNKCDSRMLNTPCLTWYQILIAESSFEAENNITKLGVVPCLFII